MAIVRLASQAVRHRWPVLIAAALMTAASVAVTVQRFRIGADVERPIDQSALASGPDRVREGVPPAHRLLAMVIDGRTPAIAGDAVARLEKAPWSHPSELATVYPLCEGRSKHRSAQGGCPDAHTRRACRDARRSERGTGSVSEQPLLGRTPSRD